MLPPLESNPVSGCLVCLYLSKLYFSKFSSEEMVRTCFASGTDYCLIDRCTQSLVYQRRMYIHLVIRQSIRHTAGLCVRSVVPDMPIPDKLIKPSNHRPALRQHRCIINRDNYINRYCQLTHYNPLSIPAVTPYIQLQNIPSAVSEHDFAAVPNMKHACLPPYQKHI